jgi:hypothetical protein
MSPGKALAALLAAGAVAAVVVVTVRSLPDIQRYLKIRRM